MDAKNRFDQKYKMTPGAFGSDPMPIVKQALKYVPQGKALDLGVGNGRNALFLLSEPFSVTGVDVSEEGLKILRKNSKDNPKLNLVVSDVLKFETEEKFDLILAIGLLHFLKIEDIHLLIKKMEGWTAKNGVNVIAARMVQNFKNDLPHIFAPNELRNLYQKDGWEIKEYSEVSRGDRKVASLIAQKL